MVDPLRKRIIITAGPNGAGKTTFARSFLPEEAGLPRFINADQIAAGLSGFAPEIAAIRAGRLMLEEIKLCVSRGNDFAFETTLAGLSYLNKIEQWWGLGYKVSLYFLSLPNVETAVARVSERVKQGGHNIPENVIIRRYKSGLSNFHNYYKMVVSDWALYDNSDDQTALIEWNQANGSQ
jgi:predicted ABC-type ATPase